MYFDAHIHLERYRDEEIAQFCREERLVGLIAVSMDLASSKRTLALKNRYPDKVYAACGFHPEQEPVDLRELIRFIRQHRGEIDAIGEIGLPYYLRKQALEERREWNEEKYETMLKQMLEVATELDKPVILHGVREDVGTICGLLERYEIKRAHFHWIKANTKTLRHMAEKGYYISFTPDILYKERTQQIARIYPLSRIMAETDGPWPFEGPFAGKKTVPGMTESVVQELANLRGMSAEEMGRLLVENALRFIRGTN
jgi:TatD DNase family protein